MTNAINVMEAAAMAALAGYLEATGQRRDAAAERAYLNHVIKAWERTVLGETAEQRIRRARLHLAEQAVNRVREQAAQ